MPLGERITLWGFGVVILLGFIYGYQIGGGSSGVLGLVACAFLGAQLSMIFSPSAFVVARRAEGVPTFAIVMAPFAAGLAAILSLAIAERYFQMAVPQDKWAFVPMIGGTLVPVGIGSLALALRRMRGGQ